MGTVHILASVDVQAINSRAMIGAFIFTVFIIAFYNIFKSQKMIKLVAYSAVVGVIITSSIILLTSAIYAIVDNPGVFN